MVPRKTRFSENVGPISKLGSVRDGSRNLVFGDFVSRRLEVSVTNF